MVIHELKVWPQFYGALESGRKPFEVRRDDRVPAYAEGHVLDLREWRSDEDFGGTDVGDYDGQPRYTGQRVQRRIIYVLRHADFPAGVPEGWCVLGLAPVERG